ncbi:MAG: hypothetical protein WBG32_07635 [Nodosilinea sp.]
MTVAAFLIAGLVAFSLSFWLTQRLRRQTARTSKPSSPRPSSPRIRAWRRSPRTARANLHPLPPIQPSGVDLDSQVRDLLSQGKLIDAVKRVRETNGCSLRDAKAYIDERLP